MYSYICVYKFCLSNTEVPIIPRSRRSPGWTWCYFGFPSWTWSLGWPLLSADVSFEQPFAAWWAAYALFDEQPPEGQIKTVISLSVVAKSHHVTNTMYRKYSCCANKTKLPRSLCFESMVMFLSPCVAETCVTYRWNGGAAPNATNSGFTVCPSPVFSNMLKTVCISVVEKDTFL